MMLLQLAFIEWKLIISHTLRHRLRIGCLQTLNHLPGLRNNHPLQTSQYLRHFAPINRFQILVRKRYKHIAVDGLIIDKFDGQGTEESLLEFQQPLFKRRTQLLKTLGLDMREFTLVVQWPWETLAASQREELPQTGADLIFGILLVVTDRL